MNFDDAPPPRTWSKDERYLFVQLPPPIRIIINRHARLDSLAVRKAQNTAAMARQKLARLRKEIVKLRKQLLKQKKEFEHNVTPVKEVS